MEHNALVTTLVIRISQMSGWVLFLVAGLFENTGVVEEGMETISRPHQIVDRPDAGLLEVPRGEIRFEGIGFNYGSVKGLPGADPKRINDRNMSAADFARGSGREWLVELLSKAGR